LTLLDEEGPSARTIEQLEAEILVHVQSKQSGGAQIGRAYLMPTSGPPMPFREYTVNRHGWAESYSSDQPLGYVFAVSELANFVFLAVEKIIRLEFDVRLPPAAAELAKRDGETLKEIKRALAQRGFYKDAPYDLRPTPSRLDKADVTSIIARFELKLAAFQSPQIEATTAKGPLDQRIFHWLKQFDSDEHIDCALHVLEAFKMLTREDTVSAVRAFITKNPQFSGATVVPFGDARDSGVIQGYFASDLAGREISRCCSIEDAVRIHRSRQIIFLDDFVASGGQAADILAAGFGIDALRKPLGEQREMFGDDIREHLVGCEVAFVFTAGWSDGTDVVRQLAKELKLRAVVYRHLDENVLPFAFDGVLADLDPQVVDGFKKRCREIGASLMASAELAEGRFEDGKADQRALGYGNRGMLLASPFNVPAQTLTAIWGKGDVAGVDWQPLMMRRKKV
jgi:hypothetical protein